jgi:hypothetical protein
LDRSTFQDIGFPYTPQVSLTKWLEPRHTVHVNDRWSTSKIDMLQAAFFNGTGLETWENVWGIWNQLTDRDQEAIRRVATIEREFPDLLVSQGWEPHTPTIQNGSVFASRWPGDGSQTLWTLVNRSTTATTGDQLTVPDEAGLHYYDVWNGVELQPNRGQGFRRSAGQHHIGSAQGLRELPTGHAAHGGATAEQFLGRQHPGDPDDDPDPLDRAADPNPTGHGRHPRCGFPVYRQWHRDRGRRQDRRAVPVGDTTRPQPQPRGHHIAVLH